MGSPNGSSVGFRVVLAGFLPDEGPAAIQTRLPDDTTTVKTLTMLSVSARALKAIEDAN